MTGLTGSMQPSFDLIDRFVAAEGVPAAALAIAHRGEIIATHFAGEAVPGRAAGAETLWPLASISKLYTAATILTLVERGAIALATPVRSVLPDFDGDGREQATIRHLLTHTAGVIYEPPDMVDVLKAQTPLAAMVDLLYRAPLRYPPGEGQAYSDLGYALLGRIATAVTGTPFPALVQELVLTPAGLHDTTLAPDAAQTARAARVVGAMAAGTAGAMYNSPYALALGHPAFGVLASVADLARFALCFAPGGRPFLSAATVQAMTTDQTGDAITCSGVRPWGLGFEIKNSDFPSLASPGSYGHGGATGCLVWIDPVYEVVVAFVSTRHYNADPLGFELRQECLLNTVLASLTRGG
ncbi:MAG: serine hydrolase domain-containing protein [Thermomicrobiales bacterium]